MLFLNNRSPVLICFILIVSLVVIPGCKKQESQVEETIKKVKIRVAPVSEYIIDDKIELTGSIIPYEKVIISNKNSGKVIKLYVDLGDKVSKGQLLAQINPVDYNLKYKESLAHFESTKATLEGVDIKTKTAEEHSLVLQTKANLDDARLRMERLKDLAKQQLVSQQDYDSAYSKFLAAQAAYENSKTNLEKMQKDLNIKKASMDVSAQTLADTNVLAPISGYIQKRNVSLGEFLNPYSPMFELVQNNPLKIQASVPERFALKVEPGQQVAFSVDALPGKIFKGIITRVAPALDEKTRTLDIEITLDNKDNILKSGLFATITIDLGTEHKGLFVPESAVYNTVGLNKVFTVLNGKAKEHIVDLGEIVDDKIEVLGDIKISDKIINTDVDTMSEGLEVEVVKVEDAKK